MLTLRSYVSEKCRNKDNKGAFLYKHFISCRQQIDKLLERRGKTQTTEIFNYVGLFSCSDAEPRLNDLLNYEDDINIIGGLAEFQKTKTFLSTAFESAWDGERTHNDSQILVHRNPFNFIEYNGNYETEACGWWKISKDQKNPELYNIESKRESKFL